MPCLESIPTSPEKFSTSPQFVVLGIKTRAEIKLQQQLGGAIGIGIFCIAVAIGIDFGISGQ